MGQPFLGDIVLWPGSFAPADWAFCDGRLIPISENNDLFNLIGVTFGGDGQETFALPDLRGRAPLHRSNAYALGTAGGSASVALTTGAIPAHRHAVQTAALPGNSNAPSPTRVLADQASGVANDVMTYLAYDSANQTSLAPVSISSKGASLPHENMQPWVALNFIISLKGIFPTET